MQQYQDELRQGNIVGQAIACFFASFLFLRTYLNTPTGLYFGLSIFFLVLAFFLIIVPFIRPLLAMGERVLDYMWLAISYVSLAGLIKGWLDGLSGLSGASCIFQVFFWAGLVLIIIYAVHIVRSSWKKGRRLKSTQ